ncbi:type II restriction endonuclease subunit R, partial [Salmonella enterica subsp. enterica serovar Albany]|nr:type II restriction endonuclease subunit R [Salmonella enterica]EBX8729405.1 type II restriction endonuclease subunit R [Salmonella enterica subsp. enterica serovar Albany]EDI4478810.1 type II restriction endonuclease subunit R [Salmonella enterica subsp. enterica serovar Altona]EGS7952164.1 AAA domain-containing protein [Salmonella enterica subsp. enterica serovar Albany]
STWRNLFELNIKDAVVNTLSTTQTLPLFSLINKVITIANNDSKDYSEKTMQISKEALTNTINYLETQIPDNNQYILELSKYSEHSTFIESVNKIFYGAPGTGKSHRINEILGSSKYIRTVFYPDMLYSDFVGSLRPRTIEDSEKNKKVIYEYRAGPFLRALILALNSKDEQVYLVIEEINRASASAVFGELFQLLDRNEFGESKYEIDINDPDMLDYINERVNDKLLSLRIPQNLSILATMNSSDQAVMPMDTAFKRRWQFEYMLIDYSNATKGEIPINIYNEDANIETINITWGNFSKILNDELKELNVPEDRLLGHRFLDDNELKTKEKATETVAGKLLVYLWDDVLRHGKKSLIFRTEEFKTFGELHNAFLSGKPIFNDTIEEKIKNFNL